MSTAPDLRSARRALTLLEVVVGLAILSLMSGAIYGIVSGAVESSASLAFIHSEDRRVEAFLNNTRVALAHLPAAATLELKILENEPLRQELILRGVSHAFVWGERSWWSTPNVTLAPLRWPEDRLPPPARADLRGKGEKVTERFSLAMTVPDFYRTDRDGEITLETDGRSVRVHTWVERHQ